MSKTIIHLDRFQLLRRCGPCVYLVYHVQVIHLDCIYLLLLYGGLVDFYGQSLVSSDHANPI